MWFILKQTLILNFTERKRTFNSDDQIALWVDD